MRIIKLNREYIKAVNSCDKDEMYKFFESISMIDNAYTNKLYLWNWFRGKDFYINFAGWTIQLARFAIYSESSDDFTIFAEKVERNIKIVMNTERSFKNRQSFVWNLTKHVPILTVDTIQYMSPDRIENILLGEKTILNDDATRPFIKVVASLKKDIKKTEELVNFIST